MLYRFLKACYYVLLCCAAEAIGSLHRCTHEKAEWKKSEEELSIISSHLSLFGWLLSYSFLCVQHSFALHWSRTFADGIEFQMWNKRPLTLSRNVKCSSCFVSDVFNGLGGGIFLFIKDSDCEGELHWFFFSFNPSRRVLQWNWIQVQITIHSLHACYMKTITNCQLLSHCIFFQMST